MKLIIFCLLTLFISFKGFAQVGIGTTNPDASSLLDLESSEQGILIPRIALSDISQTSLDGINPAATGLLIFNTNAAITGGAGLGFYFYNGSVWEKLRTTIAGGDTDWVELGGDIERPSGDVYIGDTNATNNNLFISNQIIDWDNTSYVLDPNGLNRLNELRLDPGSATAVSLRFDTADTGLFSPSTDVIAAAVQGTERLRLTNTGAFSLGSNAANRYVFPLTRGTSGQVLELDGTGNLNWTTPATGNDVDWLSTGGAPPSAITSNLYTEGNVSIGNSDMNRPLSVSTTTNEFVLELEHDGNPNLPGTLIQNYAANDGTGTQFGLRNNLTKTGSGAQYGVLTLLLGDTNGIKRGIQNQITGNGSGVHIGTNNIMNANNGMEQYGTINLINGDGIGTKYGTANRVFHDGDGNQIGSFNDVDGDGNGTHMGVRAIVDGIGNGTHYGILSSLSGSGTGTKYGGYFQVSTVANGDQYAVYANALRSSGTTYAGYFLGDVAIGTNSTNIYTMPQTRGTDGQIMQIDATGQISWIDLPAPLQRQNNARVETEARVEALERENESLRSQLKSLQERMNAILERLDAQE